MTDESRGRLERAIGYKGDPLNLPVADLAAAVPYYETVLGFKMVARAEAPIRTATLARDAVQIGLAENGGDPTQDGCAFHVVGLDLLHEDLRAKAGMKQVSGIDVEMRNGAAWRVFYLVAPDGLCYWFGERAPS